jgi:hypothetical protein
MNRQRSMRIRIEKIMDKLARRGLSATTEL